MEEDDEIHYIVHVYTTKHDAHGLTKTIQTKYCCGEEEAKSLVALVESSDVDAIYTYRNVHKAVHVLRTCEGVAWPKMYFLFGSVGPQMAR